MNYPSPRDLVCKLYCKLSPRSSLPVASGGLSYRRGARVDQSACLFEPVVFHVRRRQVDPGQRSSGAYPGIGEQDRGHRVSLEVGVALLDQPGRDTGDLVTDLGDGQGHVGGLREGILDALLTSLGVVLAAESVEDASVGLCIGYGEGRDPTSRGISAVGEFPGAFHLVRGQAGGHTREGGGEGDRYGGHGAST